MKILTEVAQVHTHQWMTANRRTLGHWFWKICSFEATEKDLFELRWVCWIDELGSWRSFQKGWVFDPSVWS